MAANVNHNRLRADAADALRQADRRAAEAEARAGTLQGDVELLAAELSERPTPQEAARLRRELDALECKIASLKNRAAEAGGGGDEDGEVDGSDADADGKSSAGAQPPRRLPPREAAARAREIARLGLGAVAELPREALVAALQDACLQLRLRDPSALRPALAKTLAVLGAVPALEAFVADVCGLAFREGLAFCPRGIIDGGITPGAAPRALAAWLRALRQGEALRRLLLRLRGALRQRAGAGGPGDPLWAAAPEAEAAAAAADAAPGEAEAAQLLAQGPALVAAAERLVAAEADALAARETLAAADGLLAAADAEGVLQRVVAHAQRLLGAADVAGVLPALNRLYVARAELGNFFAALSSLLALPRGAGPAAAVAAVRRLVEGAAGGNGGGAPGAAGRWRVVAGQLEAAAEGGGDGAARLEGAAVAALRAAAEGLGVDASGNGADGDSAARRELDALLLRLGADDAEAAAARHRALLARLARAEAALPRYQRVAAALLDALGLASLDDVVPAVEAALAAARAAGVDGLAGSGGLAGGGDSSAAAKLRRLQKRRPAAATEVPAASP